MALRGIQHPGIEINEIDISQSAPAIAGTYALVPGFTDKGDAFEPTEITSMDEFQTIYGKPTNEAERYTYYASKDVLDNGAHLIVGKLPYDNIYSTKYNCVGLNLNAEELTTPIGISGAVSGDFGSDDEITESFTKYRRLTVGDVSDITNAEYSAIEAGADFTQYVGDSEYLIVNDTKSTVNKDNEGVFVAVVDAFDAFYYQRVIDTNPGTLVSIESPNLIQPSDFVNPLGAVSGEIRGDGTVSETIAGLFPTFDYTDGGTKLVTEYGSYIGVIVGKVYKDFNNEGRLNVSILESHVGSLIEGKKNPANGQSTYIGDFINGNSKHIKFFKDRSFTDLDIESGAVSDPDTGAETPVDNTDLLVYRYDSYSDNRNTDGQIVGFKDEDAKKLVDGEAVATNLDILYAKLTNIDEQQLDLVIDAGLSTIAEFCDGDGSVLYLPGIDSDDKGITGSGDLEVWRTVASRHIDFCCKIRKDCMAIIDAPRNLVLDGDAKWIRKSAPENSFANTIGPRLKYTTGLNNSYSAQYATWVKIIDGFSGKATWLPPSVKVGGVYAYTDSNAEFWDAPAGLRRGVLSGVVDIAFNPNGKEEDQLYTKSLNYIKHLPNAGYVVWGQKTTQTTASAFDRVNVRRLFLRLERYAYHALKSYVFQPNNTFTRRQIVDVLTPEFRNTKIRGGLIDYQLVCDETNNTPDVIDRNELKIAVLLKPTKISEFILVDFYATRSDQNFDEIAL